MLTPGCCWWYLAKATAKNGATNVDPAPVRVALWPPEPKLATVGADPALVVAAVVVEHAPRASRMTAAAAAQAARYDARRRCEPGSSLCPDMVVPLLEVSGISAAGDAHGDAVAAGVVGLVVI